ncbi:MAG TPA: hypothetical protein VFM65_02045 [Flavobacteriaceae bacterium]|nr:hypothetical protein [Flavobacteriaceae bacterium]
MALSRFLKDQGYDLINGPVRNHQPLQLWLKRIFNEAELYYADVQHAFKSEVALREIENPALTVDSSQKDDYTFNIGITILEQILESLGLGRFQLAAKIASGKRVSIAYDHSFAKEYPVGNLESYFHQADFLHPNPSLLKNANRNDILIISGTLFAKHLVAEIETNFDLDASLMADLNDLAKGNLEFSKTGNNVIKLVSGQEGFFPIAVKANKLDFDHSKFDKLKLITDNRNFF